MNRCSAICCVSSAQTPDLTLILDIPPETGLARSRGTGLGEDRYERMDPSFHATVRQAFLDIAQREPQRCAVLDATQDQASLLGAALKALDARTP